MGAGDPRLEQTQHPVVGIGRDHLVAEGDDLRGELAGAGAQLEHAGRLGPTSQAAPAGGYDGRARS